MAETKLYDLVSVNVMIKGYNGVLEEGSMYSTRNITVPRGTEVLRIEVRAMEVKLSKTGG